jgi:hypothetical protein
MRRRGFFDVAAPPQPAKNIGANETCCGVIVAAA